MTSRAFLNSGMWILNRQSYKAPSEPVQADCSSRHTSRCNYVVKRTAASPIYAYLKYNKHTTA